MDKFWEWMRSNNYGVVHRFNPAILFANEELNEWIEPTNQMLVGYMIEYLLTMGMFVAISNIADGIDKYYENLKERIEDLENSKIYNRELDYDNNK